MGKRYKANLTTHQKILRERIPYLRNGYLPSVIFVDQET